MEAQILQAQIMGDFFGQLVQTFDLNRQLWDAQEEQDGKKIAAIRNELSRQWREQ